MKINMLKAFNGDSIHIFFKDSEGVLRNILIDGGPGNTYQFKNKKDKQEAGELQKLIRDIKSKHQIIDLLILTHVDDDHIGGLLKWFKNDKEAKYLIKKVWFNSGRLISEYFGEENTEENALSLGDATGLDTSIRQGVKFEEFLEENDLWERRLIHSSKKLKLFDFKLTFLSPDIDKLKVLLGKWEKEAPITETSGKDDYGWSLEKHIQEDFFKEDTSVHNGSSIGFILEYNGKRGVFLGDAHPNQIAECLRSLGYSERKPLEAEFLKVSHHGSKANTNYELLELIDTDNYIISSNGDKHQLPDKQCLARIVNHNNKAKIYFNYPEKIPVIFKDEDYNAFPDFQAMSAENGFTL
ncbi:ComEC/Rec2 family competence protein [Roseivirga sp. BDSF3-8]|uniref:ComEC/Rec2 family competence protein n=1 Tax=Roseivirga sp. BDSF3-8 TaxID=3241598 RepID=UPI003531C4B6